MDEATFLSEIALSDGGMALIDDNTPATLRQCSAPSMANMPIDPQPFIPQGFQIQAIEGRNGVSHAIVPHRQRRHEDCVIESIFPHPNEVFFPNVRDVLEEFLQEVAQVGFTEIQPCPFGEACVRVTHVRDRNRLIQQGPHGFGDVFISIR